jgi:hypothetical protein
MNNETNTQSESALTSGTTSNADAFIQRMWVDHELTSKLLLNRDIAATVKAEGFNLEESFVPWVELAVKKIRTYVTDQLHFLEAKRSPSADFKASGNGVGDW